MWRWIGGIFLFLILVVAGYYGYTTYFGQDNSQLLLDMCNEVEGIPAWATHEGMIFDYGYLEFSKPDSDKFEIVDALISSEIYFLYTKNANCEPCQAQIQWFDYSWERYDNSKYTVDCLEILNSEDNEE